MKKADITVNIKASRMEGHIGATKYENDDWGTIAFSFPRNQLKDKFVDIELQYNCIYFLIGYGGTREEIYVGQAGKRNNGGSVLNRLREHDASTTESYRNHWHWVVVVTNKNDAWGLDDLNALKHKMYTEIPYEQCLNGNNPNSGDLSTGYYEDKVEQIKSYITAVGFNIFANSLNSNQISISANTSRDNYSLAEDLHNWATTIPEVITPSRVVNEMLDNLPEKVWNDETVFMDLACKGGEYLRAIFDRLMQTEIVMAKYPNELEISAYFKETNIWCGIK